MENKAKKKKRGKKVVNKKHTYKRGNTPNDEDDGKLLTREPKVKKMRKDTCQAIQTCNNERCSCKSNNKKCNNKCKCRNKCNNK